MKRLLTALSVGSALLAGAYAPTAFADPKTPTPAPATSTPSPDSVGAGKFCSSDLEGKSAKASDGTALSCTKGSDGRDRWTASGSGTDGATAGAFCSKDLEGKSGKASDGSALVCTGGSDGRDRWTKK